MITLIKSIVYVIQFGSAIPEQHPCAMNISDLNLEQKIEISIGCSEINGKYAYAKSKLNAIVNFPNRKM